MCKAHSPYIFGLPPTCFPATQKNTHTYFVELCTICGCTTSFCVFVFEIQPSCVKILFLQRTLEFRFKLAMLHVIQIKYTINGSRGAINRLRY